MSLIYKPTDVIAGDRYQIIRLIGEGGAAIVYQCTDKSSLQEVAVKVLRYEHIDDKKQIEIFKHEAELASLLQHPNIVTVYDIITESRSEKQIYHLVMEYLPGGSLTMQTRTAIGVAQSVHWMKQLLSA